MPAVQVLGQGIRQVVVPTEDLACGVAVAEEVGAVFSEGEFDDVLDGGLDCEEGFDFGGEVAPVECEDGVAGCRGLEWLALTVLLVQSSRLGWNGGGTYQAQCVGLLKK